MSRFSRAVAPLAALLLTGGLGVVAVAPPATATSTILCRGYDGCASLGMTASGYKPVSGTMFWRMYSGHNCTNYAAYRMVKSGLPNERPWSGSGNASNWGHAMASITDQTPRVGAVAWWDAYVRPAGSSGHVAYVERVVSSTEIIVSQDSWGGDFSWARITKSGGSWPSGFVHFNDVRLVNTAAPQVTGTARVGQVLTATPGTWSQSGLTLSYKWRADGTAIPDATTSTYLLTQAEEGKRISLRVKATKAGYPRTKVFSAETAAVQPGSISNEEPPAIIGTPQVDAVLTARPGTWSPAPSAVSYQWKADGLRIHAATDRRYAPRPGQVGKEITVKVTASRTGYANVHTFAPETAPVLPGTLTVLTSAGLAGTAHLGRTLTVDPGSFAPVDATASVAWKRDGVNVDGAAGTTYPLTAADLGRRITATVELTKPGYTTVTSSPMASERVRSVSTMTATSTAGTGRATVTATVRAQDVDPASGLVRISWRGTVLKQVSLVDSQLSTVVRGLPPGLRRLDLRYLGGPSTTRATTSTTVRVG